MQTQHWHSDYLQRQHLMAGLIITANGHRASAASTPFASTKCYCSPATYSSTFMMTCLLIGVGFIIASRALCSCSCSPRHGRISCCRSLPTVVERSTEVASDLSLGPGRHRPRSPAGSVEPASAPSALGGFARCSGSARR